MMWDGYNERKRKKMLDCRTDFVYFIEVEAGVY